MAHNNRKKKKPKTTADDATARQQQQPGVVEAAVVDARTGNRSKKTRQRFRVGGCGGGIISITSSNIATWYNMRNTNDISNINSYSYCIYGCCPSAGYNIPGVPCLTPSIHPFLGRHRATPYLLCLILVNVSMNRSRVVMATTFLRICVMKPEPRREGYSLLHNSVCTIRVVGVVMITIRMVTILQSGHNCGSIALMNR